MSEPYDFIVIGGGSAGYAAASTAARLGLRTAVIDGGEEIGGLCILRGCMPSKTFLESSRRAEVIRHAAEFGLKAEYHGVDASAVQARKRFLISDFAGYRQGQLEKGTFDFIRGRAQFIDANTLDVRLRAGGEQRIAGRSFLIAVGSRIDVPEIPGLVETGFLTSDEVLASEEYPDSVCLLGGGAIALELASFYSGLGIKTTVVQRGRHLLKEMDEDIATALLEGMRKRDVTVHVDTHLNRIEKVGGAKRVEFTEAGTESVTVEAAEIVVALGRKPAIGALGLGAAGVETHRGYCQADAEQRTSVPHIFAAGDVCGPFEVVHLAVEQGTLAARNAARLLGKLSGSPEQMDYTLKLFATFTQPQAAMVGLTEREAKEKGLAFAVATYPFADHGKSMVLAETDGFVKLIAERGTGRILGGSCVGPEASELIHEIVVAMRFGATAGQLALIPHYHPTLSEIWTYPAEELAES